MGITADAINDCAEFLSNGDDFGVPMVLRSPDNEVANIIGYSRKIAQKLDILTGMIVLGTNASVSVHEKTIAAANPQYPVRNADQAEAHAGEVNMDGHLVEVADATGVVKQYRVAETRPNETTGSILLILQAHQE